MKNVLPKLLYLMIFFSYASISCAGDSKDNGCFEKSWIDIPHESFMEHISKDEKLSKLTKKYHQIDKRRLENFTYRINILNEISQYIETNSIAHDDNLLLKRFGNMAKKKAWYLKRILDLYSQSKQDIVRIFSQIDKNDNVKDILYLRNSIEFDLKLPTYWGMFALEMIDPCRRMLTPQYHKWINQYIDEYPNFFAWLEGEEVTFRTPQTSVFNDKKIKNYKIKFSKGLMYYCQSGKLVNTEDNVEYIYIVNLLGEMFITKSSDYIKHTSLSAGKPVLGAGSIKINNGQVIYISNESGHYRPEAHILQKILYLFEKKHKVSISNLNVNYYHNNNVVNESFYDFKNKTFNNHKIQNVDLLYSFKY